MAKIVKKFITDNAVDENKIRLSNNAYLKARNAADSGNINILKVNASDKVEFASVPQATSDASAANDLVRYSQVQALLEGLKPKEAARAASTANVVIATGLEDGDTLDGVTLATGDRVLLKDQTDPTENGVYIVAASGAASRSLDMNLSAEFPGAYILVSNGTANQGKGYVFTVAEDFVLGTDDVTLVQFSSSGAVIGGDMISVSGSTVSVDLATTSGLESTNPGNNAGQLRIKLEASNPTLRFTGSNELGVKLDAAGAIATGASGLATQVDNSTIEINTNALRVKDAGITLAKLASNSVDENKLTTSVAGNGLAGGGGTALSVNVDGSTLEINSDSLRVKDLGISTAKLADASVTADKLAAAVAGSGLAGGAGSALSVNVDDSTIEINSDTLRVKDAGITEAKLASNSVTRTKLGDDAVGSAEIRLDNDASLRARNAANSADVSLLKLSSSNVLNLQTSLVPETPLTMTLGSSNLPFTTVHAANVNCDISLSFTGDVGADGITVTNISDTSRIKAGHNITGLNINPGTFVLTVDSATQITLTNQAISFPTTASQLFTFTGLALKSHDDTGSATDYRGTGIMQIRSGNALGTGNGAGSGQVNVRSGNATDGGSGVIQIRTGAITGAVGASGNVDVLTGNANAGGSGDVNLTTGTATGGTRGDVNVSGNTIVLNPVTNVDLSAKQIKNMADGSAAQDAVTKAQLDAFTPTMERYTIALNGTDITNQYVEIDAGEKLKPESIILQVRGGPVQEYNYDYDALNSGAQTRIRFDSTNFPNSDLATGAGAALISGDVLTIVGIRI